MVWFYPTITMQRENSKLKDTDNKQMNAIVLTLTLDSIKEPIFPNM